MTKTELMALLKLAKAKNTDTVYDKELMEQLDHKTLRNIKIGRASCRERV